MTKQRWLTPHQAARELDLTPCRVRQLTAEGRLVHEWTPLGRLIDAADVQRLKAERVGRAVRRAPAPTAA